MTEADPGHPGGFLEPSGGFKGLIHNGWDPWAACCLHCMFILSSHILCPLVLAKVGVDSFLIQKSISRYFQQVACIGSSDELMYAAQQVSFHYV